jgi:hypothetical protein
MKKFSLKLWPRSTTDQVEQSEEPSVVDGITLGESKRFGIKSYLHQFYLSSPTIDELENPNAWYLNPPPPMQRMSSLVCRIITLMGLLLLIAGAGLIIVGYTWKPMADDLDSEITRIAITQNEDGDLFIDKSHLDELLHQNDKLKIAGFIIFALASVTIALSLVFPTCVHFFARTGKRIPFSEDNTPNEPPVKIYPSLGSRFKVTPSKLQQRISPSSGPVPVFEKVTNIQPSIKRSADCSPTEALLIGESDALLS